MKLSKCLHITEKYWKLYWYSKGDTEINFGNNRDPNVRFNWVDLNKDRSITFDEFSFALGKIWVKFSSIFDPLSKFMN